MTREADVDAHIQSERERYDNQFRGVADRNLIVPYGVEFSPSDQRAALLYAFDQLGDPRGRRVLEIGAGTGWHSSMLVHRGAHVTATDVSAVGIEAARRRFEVNRMTDRTATAVVAAEDMPFDDGTFDAVFGVAVLHHLVLDRAAPEIARVLKPGGRAVFMEPLSENRLLDLARDYAPYPGKKSPKGHRGMTFEMIERAGAHFAKTRVRPFYLTSMINRAFGKRTAITPLERLDDIIIRRSRAVWKLCRYAVITFEREAAGAA